jgi:iduronate 2-sulfatase
MAMQRKSVHHHLRPGVLPGLVFGCGLVLAQAVAVADTGVPAPGGLERPNVLFLAMDDLRPQLPVYGKHYMHTPAIDRLAASGVTFAHAYSSVPVCGASRASLMTGLYPTRERFVDVGTDIDADAAGVLTMPGFFKSHGYTAISLGKVVHHRLDARDAWSEEPWYPRNARADYSGWRNYILPENIALDMDRGRQPPPWEAPEVADEAYFDGEIAARAVARLRALASAGQPFFLAVGFLKPHLPFNAPRRYWDLYPPGSEVLTDNPLFPETAPGQALHYWPELRRYAEVPDGEGPVPEEVARKLVRGYYAGTSYADAQVGKVLAELERLGLAGSTIVVLWGDHGWSLGEHGLWAKHSVFNVANQIPIIVRAPGMQRGRLAQGLVESVDIYPTLAELAGLPPPGHLQGRSFVPMLQDPAVAIRDAVFPRWQSGDSIRTDRYYYTEWRDPQGSVIARMLYDHYRDPDERVNVAEELAYANAVAGLSRRLARHIRETRKAAQTIGAGK